MPASNPAVLFREDTMLGVCQALGDDFGFNPLYLRMAFAVPVLFSPLWTFAAYLGLGVLVAISRLLVPARPRSWTLRSAAAAATALVRRRPAKPEVVECSAEPERMPLAA
ncbi:PspC domain-containing protein [Sphingomonas parva]|uniref:PspC domain-containing protein n=1 Tax=Sphingomonas parva TaxID=2555898 RepID=A0A4Y8ZWX1_9SPHN|nr:PspC domain-containing protein [Sphingomonas parva]TFI58986.1 PspC domain-containing protein [Sphingomonas parva]